MTDPYARIRILLEAHAARLVRTTDTADVLSLDTPHRQPNGRPLFFGSVTRKARGVALHLMPLYTDPDLLEDMPEALRRRMTGKSCFTFAALDDDQHDALAALLAAAMERYAAHGYVAG